MLLEAEHAGWVHYLSQAVSWNVQIRDFYARALSRIEESPLETWMQIAFVIMRDTQLDPKPYWGAFEGQRECQADLGAICGPLRAMQGLHW